MLEQVGVLLGSEVIILDLFGCGLRAQSLQTEFLKTTAAFTECVALSPKPCAQTTDKSRRF